MHEFSYLYGTLSVGVFWLFFFVIRPDLRKDMLLLSFLFGIGGVTSEYCYARDWWSPETLTGTMIGVEDFMFGFFFGGATSTCYEVIFSQTSATRNSKPTIPTRLRYIALTICTIFFGSTVLLELHSFTATVLSFGFCILVFLWQRPDLVRQAIIGALFGLLMSFLFFGIPVSINNGWIESAWSLKNLSGLFVFYMPVEDVLWFTIAGAFIAPLLNFWKNRVSLDAATAPIISCSAEIPGPVHTNSDRSAAAPNKAS
ncbi:MAG: lycopene cyclase domain-containing protein [Mariprofundaceae bacterium]